MAVFLVAGFLAFGGLFLKKTGLIEEKGVLGGPTSSPSILSSAKGAELRAQGAGSAILPSGTGGGSGGYGALSSAALPSAGGTAMRDWGEPIGPAFDRSGMVTYSVQGGDNLSRVAAYFGISLDTLVSANPGVKANALQIGQMLKILPTTGVIYQTRSGDTIESISNDFGIPQEKIMQFNRSVNFALLDPGTSVVIPGGNITARLIGSAALPNFGNQFIMPANGYNWGILHHYNAIDIANSCGTPVVAAAEGLVVPDEGTPNAADGWNAGYGNFVLIEHPFGDQVRTRYAHLQKIAVQVGEYVKQGEAIGLMGETGDASGCHVHFEVYGAQNPFAKS